MKFQLKALHHNGIALTSPKLASPPHYIGGLIAKDWPQDVTFGCFVCLEMSTPGTLPDIIALLFEPQIVNMIDNQMTLHGYQIHIYAEAGAMRHYTHIEASPLSPSYGFLYEIYLKMHLCHPDCFWRFLFAATAYCRVSSGEMLIIS